MTNRITRPLRVFLNDQQLINQHSLSWIPQGLLLRMMFNDEKYFEFVSERDKAEILCLSYILDNLYDNIVSLSKTFPNLKLVILPQLFNIDEDMTTSWVDKFNDGFHAVNSDKSLPMVMGLTMDYSYNKAKQSDHDYIFYTDFVLNNQKLLYKFQPDSIFDPERPDISGTYWYKIAPDNNTKGLRRENFDIADIKSFPDWNKISGSLGGYPSVPRLYLSPNNTRFGYVYNRHLSAFKDYDHIYPEWLNSNNDYDMEQLLIYKHLRDFLRQDLCTLLSNYPGYLGNQNINHFLIGQGVTPGQLDTQISMSVSPGNVPLNNEYYKNSVLTINVETLSKSQPKNTPRLITEKTWDILIKGHFMLTFAYQGFYQDLKQIYNIQLPDWIDYDFDTETDNLQRWARFKLEVIRVLNMGPEKLFKLRERDKHILIHNRNQVLTEYKDTIGNALENFMVANTDDHPTINFMKSLFKIS